MKARILLMLLVMLAGANNAKADFNGELKIGGQSVDEAMLSQYGITLSSQKVGLGNYDVITLNNTIINTSGVGLEYTKSGQVAGGVYIVVNGICTITSTNGIGLSTNQATSFKGSGSLYVKGNTDGLYLGGTISRSYSNYVNDGVELICEGANGAGISGYVKNNNPIHSLTIGGDSTSLIIKGSTKAIADIGTLTLNDDATIHNTDETFNTSTHALNSTDWVHITATGLPIDEDHFPDEKFRNMLNGTGYDIRDDGRSYRYDYHQDGYLSRYELSLVKKMYANSLGILNMEGIQHFTSLKLLSCGNGNNSFESINLSTLTELETFMCYGVGLTSIDLSHNTNLRELEIYMNKLTDLDVSQNTKLTKLDCRQNLIASLDVSKCPDLETLNCSGRDSYSLSPMTSLNVSGCTKLKSLSCAYAQLTTLDVSTCTALTSLTCGNNVLNTINVSGLANLSYINCWYNALTSINLEGCANLNTFYFNNNPIASIDLSECPAINRIDCSYTQLTTLDVSGKNLSYLDCENCTELVSIDCSQNILTSFDVSRCTALQEIRCYQNNLSETNLNNFKGTLPTVATPSPIYLVSDDPGEHNACTAEQAFSIFSKGWKALQKVGDDWQLIPFEGEVTVDGLKYKCIASADGTLHAEVIGVENLDAPTFAFADSVALSGNATPFPVTTIGRLAFKGVSYPNNITIPDYITTIEPLAFDSCRMTMFTIPPSVTNLCDSAFVRCNVLWDLYVRWPQPLPIAEGTDPFPNSKGGCVLHVPFGANAYQTDPYWSQFKSVEMEGGEVVDEQGLKYKCYLNDNGEADHAEVSGWTAVQPPRDLVNIAESVTCEVNGVETAFTVTHIAPMAFASNTYIYIFVPATVQSIGNYSQTYRSVFGDKVPQFLVMKGTTPPSVKSANDFGSISSSDCLIVPQGSEAAYANASVWSRYQRHGIIDANGDYFYVNNDKATYFFTDRDTTTIRVPETITMNGVEYPVTSFQSIVFNPQTETIILHANFTDLANSSFYYLSNLKTVKVAWTEDIPTSTNISEVPIRQAVLIVPRGTKSLYANKRPWSYFSAIIELGDANADGVTDIADALDVVNYLLGLPTSETFRADLADANDDGQVTIADVTAIVAAIAGQ
ncbi:MAG: leucine-rich repeat protein [Prevotella sp.]|nr:leucine-rich repeat protein [Prevotella sp.]